MLTGHVICTFSISFPNLLFFSWSDKLTPAAFEKHSGRETARKWKNNLWVIVNGEKVPLYKTPLLKYYNQALKGANRSHRSQNGRVCHRDEFVRCSMCNKERRFRLRNKDECRMYHDALADENWKCADMPYDKYAALTSTELITTWWCIGLYEWKISFPLIFLVRLFRSFKFGKPKFVFPPNKSKIFGSCSCSVDVDHLYW